MSATVPHLRPTFDATGIVAGRPVAQNEWGPIAGIGNWCNGHGGQLIPCCAIGRTHDEESFTYNFYVGPKARAVERKWNISLAISDGVDHGVQITAGSAAAQTFYQPTTLTGASATNGAGPQLFTLEIREPLSAKTSTAGGTTLVIGTVGDGALAYVSTVSMYEQTRGILLLDSTDYGVDLTSVATRQPIADTGSGSGSSIRGASDAYKNLDARRAGVFHWSTPTTDPLDVTQVSYTDIFPLYPPALGAIVSTGTTSTTFKCAVYAKVNAGSGNVRFSSTQNGSNVVLAVTGTSFAWVTGDLTINAEDLTAADGRRSSGWETCRVEAQKDTATTLSIAAISILRTTSPV